MPQLTQMTVLDREATPVSHVFKPETISGAVASLVESSGVPLGNNRITASLTRTKDAGRYKPVLKLTFPVVQNETINGVSRPTIVRTAYAEVTFSFDPSSTRQERNNVVGMTNQCLGTNNTLLTAVLVDLEGIY